MIIINIEMSVRVTTSSPDQPITSGAVANNNPVSNSKIGYIGEIRDLQPRHFPFWYKYEITGINS
jgi:hypothetical protein